MLALKYFTFLALPVALNGPSPHQCVPRDSGAVTGGRLHTETAA
jgi:hypothetical protein